MLDAFAIQLIPHADFQFIHTIQHIKLGQGDTVNTANLRRLTHQYRIEPAATALAPRHCTKFMATLAEQFTNIILLFGRERPRADACCISLGNTQHIINRTRPHART